MEKQRIESPINDAEQASSHHHLLLHKEPLSEKLIDGKLKTKFSQVRLRISFPLIDYQNEKIVMRVPYDRYYFP